MEKRRPRRVGNRLHTTGYEGRVHKDASAHIVFEFAYIPWCMRCLELGLIGEMSLRLWPGLSRGNLRWLWLHRTFRVELVALAAGRVQCWALASAPDGARE